jgi:hypothetical protein
MLLVKYKGNGDVAWVKTGIGDGISYAVHVDRKDNVYITGEFYSSTISIGTQTLTRMDNDPDFFVVKLDTSGNSIWAKDGSNEYGYSITSNQNGDVFVSGNYYTATLTIDTYTFNNPGGGGGGYASFLVRYDRYGNTIWVKNFGSTAGTYVYSVASDVSNIYIAGYFHPFAPIVFGTYTLAPPSGCTQPLYLVRLDFSGNVVYANAFKAGGGNGNGNVQAWACTDKFKNVYLFSLFDISQFDIGGYTLIQSGIANVFLAKFYFNDVGIKEYEANNTGSILYPNPNSGDFIIKIEESRRNEKPEINIFDVTGRLISAEKKVSGNSSEFQLKNDLQNGMYLVKVKFDDGTCDIHHLIISK